MAKTQKNARFLENLATEWEVFCAENAYVQEGALVGAARLFMEMPPNIRALAISGNQDLLRAWLRGEDGLPERVAAVIRGLLKSSGGQAHRKLKA